MKYKRRENGLRTPSTLRNNNSLPNSCKQAELVATFKRKLKSELFYLAYGEQPTVYSVSPQSASDSLTTYGARLAKID